MTTPHFIGEIGSGMPKQPDDEMVVWFDMGFMDSEGRIHPVFRGDMTDGVSSQYYLVDFLCRASPFTKCWRRGALPHDSGYMYHFYSRDICDKALREAWIADGMKEKAATGKYGLVKLFGGGKYNDTDQGDYRIDLVPQTIQCIPSDILIPCELRPRFAELREQAAEIRKTWH